ncbi:MAG: hypothetical protein MUE49_07465, partial [Rhodospirillales bacterium]|nr:hypothetical protein [Rhodospirillales bacterium]
MNLSIALPFTVSIFIAAFFSIHPPHQTLILSDSPRYLEFDSITTATYPIFLKFFASIFSGIEPVVYVQLWLYAACVGGLGAVIARLTGSPTAGAVAAAAMLLNPEVNQYLFTIMTEPLSYALTALTLAAFGAIVLSGRTVCWVAVSIAIGLTITVRTANAAFLLPLLVALLVYRRCPAQRWPVRLAAAILPLVAVLLAEHVVWQAFHDAPRRTLAGVSAIGKAGMVGGGVPAFAADPSAPERQPLREALANDLRPMRELLAAAPNLPTWCRASYAYETFVQYRFAKDERATAESGRPGDPDSVLIALTIERLRQSPGEYVALTARHLACLWTLTIATRPQTAAYWAFIDARRPLPF